MRYRVMLCICGLLLVTACRGSESAATDSASASTGVPTLHQLATAWSGEARPRCQDHGPNGEYLSAPTEQYCVWTAAENTPTQGQVEGYTALGRVQLLHWTRGTAGAVDADRIIDSLGAALTSRGLRTRPCRSGEVPAGHLVVTRWEATTLIVELSRIAPAQGPPKLSVLAVANPKAVPDVMCPRDIARDRVSARTTVALALGLVGSVRTGDLRFVAERW